LLQLESWRRRPGRGPRRVPRRQRRGGSV